MKYLHTFALRLAALLPALVLGLAPAGSPGGEARAAEWPADAYVLRVNGLACPYCGYGVEKQFAQQEGVQATKINIDEGVVVVSVEPGTRFSDDELEQTIDDAGFALGEIVHRPAGDSGS